MPPEGKIFKCAVTEESGHIKYWKKAFKMVKQWKFLRRNKNGSFNHSKPPSQIAWMVTLKSLQQIWKFLSEEKGFDSLKPRNLNQDSIENLFGSIRGGLGFNQNPTTIQFIGSLKTQILNGLINLGSGGNCEADEGVLLSNLRTFLNLRNYSTGNAFNILQ